MQFRQAPGESGHEFTGRVEHVTTGHAARFESPEELSAFFVRILNTAQTTSSEEA